MTHKVAAFVTELLRHENAAPRRRRERLRAVVLRVVGTSQGVFIFLRTQQSELQATHKRREYWYVSS